MFLQCTLKTMVFRIYLTRSDKTSRPYLVWSFKTLPAFRTSSFKTLPALKFSSPTPSPASTLLTYCFIRTWDRDRERVSARKSQNQKESKRAYLKFKNNKCCIRCFGCFVLDILSWRKMCFFFWGGCFLFLFWRIFFSVRNTWKAGCLSHDQQLFFR